MFAQQGRVVYFQDFGCNDTADAIVSTTPIEECIYTQNTTETSYCATYAVRKQAFVNTDRYGNSQWYAQTDHTHLGDKERGCFLQVDCGLEHQLFYSFYVGKIPVGATLDISLWVVNLYTYYQKKKFEENKWKLQNPTLDLIIFEDQGEELKRFTVGPILADSTLAAPNDFTKSATWEQYRFSYTIESDYPYLFIALGNQVITSPGNDIGIDDIQVVVK